MQILTAEGRRSVNDVQILCIDRPVTLGEHLVVTLYLLDGERITGVVEPCEPPDIIEDLVAA
jgi:hypothetical protein